MKHVPYDAGNELCEVPAAIQLGGLLFEDPRLSSSKSISCKTCHDPSKAFTDGLAVAKGQRTLGRNTPSIVNSVYMAWYNWDGSADSLWCQAFGPLYSPDEMAGTPGEVAKLLLEDNEYAELLELLGSKIPAKKQADLDEASIEEINVVAMKSVAAFVRTFVKFDSEFDRLCSRIAAGNASEALKDYPAEALDGLRLFFGKAKCADCHHGLTFSDGEFHSVGIRPADGSDFVKDAGRYAGIKKLLSNRYSLNGKFARLTGQDKARAEMNGRILNSSQQYGQFKTPSLRNVELTAPYMHAGQIGTLEMVINHYSELKDKLSDEHHSETVLMPLQLNDQEKRQLLTFLQTLTSGSLRLAREGLVDQGNSAL